MNFDKWIVAQMLPPAALAELPDGWQPEDPCGNCTDQLMDHRSMNLACLNPAACPQRDRHEHHDAACWFKDVAFRLDPQVAAARRLRAVMAPGEARS